PKGRAIEHTGYPLNMAELIASIKGSSFVARTSVHSPKDIKTTSNFIEKALRYQINKKGFSFIEILSPCPTDWHLDPVSSLNWIHSTMIKTFPLGVFKDIWKSQS
ncbi:MAG: 2-oxoglutarate oxidoreductase, partial [Thermodesulfovibrionales bacterium]|nr:2-oxoglutarate oxidoreductase [Thermodesulfovibrionales bacterium]